MSTTQQDLNYAKPISVEEAIRRVLVATKPLPIVEAILTPKLLGHVLAEDLIAKEPFPSFPASIMDGYAVKAPIEPGVFSVVENVFAGDNPNFQLTSSAQVSYITTGSQVPSGANAVVKVEDTEKLPDGKVKINVATKVGAHIREIGSDIGQGECVLKATDRLGPTELGLLATTGFTKVKCYKKPVIGVLSTGNELVEPWEEPTGSQIRDSNRISLISSFQEDGYEVIDFGIMRDSKEELKNFLLKILPQCDLLVTSGGVSMGAADFIKPILLEIGNIHFNKLNMKPGKPTTFATVSPPSDPNKQVLFFGLPGNPVSCLVTKALFIDPALKRLQGYSSSKSLHAQVKVKLQSEKILLDPERPEYHRAYIKHSNNSADLYYIAESTGNQRSSRLLSMKSANGLLVLPQGPGMIETGSIVTALLVRPLDAPPAGISVHPSASLLDTPTSSKEPATLPSPPPPPTAGNTTTAQGCCVMKADNPIEGEDDWRIIKTGLLTISDRASAGVYKDESGPEMAKLLLNMNEQKNFPLRIIISSTIVVPDNPEAIKEVIESWSNPENKFSRMDLILTSGGTGFGIRDNTPETIRPLLHREAPGIAQSLLNEGLKFTPLAVLSRPVVGTRFNTFIATLPGSVKAVRENITCLQVLFPRVFELLKTGDCKK